MKVVNFNTLVTVFFFLSGGFFSLLSLLWVVNLLFLVIWIIGFIGAVNGEEKPIPVLGAWAQTMFSGI